MLNPLQGTTLVSLTTALERVAGDSVSSLWGHERWASSPDALACYWDELFNAVCARLEQLAAQSTEAPIQAGVQECAAAMAQLHASFNDERARHVQQAKDLVALRWPSDPL
jgi:hypothetical protein